MSRCFAYYPLQGHVRKGASGETLIESSIKLHNGREKGKTDIRAKKSQPKIPERNEQIEKIKKRSGTSDGRVTKVSDQKGSQREKKIKAQWKKRYEQNVHNDVDEELERSVISEEHGQPVFSRNPCYLSDSTQSCNKRKRNTSISSNCPGGEVNHGHINCRTGIKIRIKLPLQKSREPQAIPDKEPSCSTSGREDAFPENKASIPSQEHHRFCTDSNAAADKAANIEVPCLVPESREKVFSSSCITENRILPFYDDRIKSETSTYEALTQNWVPPPLQLNHGDSDDEDWLFGKKGQQDNSRGTKRYKAAMNFDSVFRSPSLWPCAQYLPEADVNALPYTVPF